MIGAPIQLKGIEVQMLVDGVADVCVNDVSGLAAGCFVTVVGIGGGGSVDGTSDGLIQVERFYVSCDRDGAVVWLEHHLQGGVDRKLPVQYTLKARTLGSIWALATKKSRRVGGFLLFVARQVGKLGLLPQKCAWPPTSVQPVSSMQARAGISVMLALTSPVKAVGSGGRRRRLPRAASTNALVRLRAISQVWPLVHP